jgi:bifunctional DNase/RNase
MLEMTIDSIRVSMMNYQHVVILKEKNSDRYLPIWIGPSEADAISVKLQNLDIARPLTHDLLRNTVSALETLANAYVSRVVVNDLKADTFYAQIVFEFSEGPIPTQIKFFTDSKSSAEQDVSSKVAITWQEKKYDGKILNKWQDKSHSFLEVEAGNGLLFELCNDTAHSRWLLTKMKLDSRPSDAIALAVRVTTPIFVEDIVLDKAGIILDKDTGKPVSPEKTSAEQTANGKVDENEMKKLRETVFYDFINTLDIDDLGKNKS